MSDWVYNKCVYSETNRMDGGGGNDMCVCLCVCRKWSTMSHASCRVWLPQQFTDNFVRPYLFAWTCFSLRCVRARIVRLFLDKIVSTRSVTHTGSLSVSAVVDICSACHCDYAGFFSASNANRTTRAIDKYHTFIYRTVIYSRYLYICCRIWITHFWELSIIESDVLRKCRF